jgi:hypothetical protein
MMQKELLTKKDFTNVGGEISHETGNDFIKAYETAFPVGPRGFALGRNILEKILAQPGCTGIRFHYALNHEGQKTVVYIGMDANGNDLLTHTMVMENGVIKSEEATVADLALLFPWWR